MPEQTDRAEADQTEGFDKILDKLRGIVERLEGGKLSLEQSLEAFEEGVRLSRKGATLLDQAERRVEILSRDGDGKRDGKQSEARPEPFPSPAEASTDIDGEPRRGVP